MDAYRETGDAVLASLGVDPQRGLDQREASSRLAQHGPNELASEPPVPAWRKFAAQFQGTLVILLLIATAISTAVWWMERESALPYEAIAIFAVVCLNAAIGFVQEERAERAVAALRAMSAAEARVLRDGEPRHVRATEVVPGDLIIVNEGDAIPADARLIESVALRAAEASLTGESVPVAKSTQALERELGIGDRRNMLFAGTAVSYGHGKAVVVATGMQTEMGHIAGLLQQHTDETTPLQRELARTGRRMGALVVAIAAVIVTTVALVEHVETLSGAVDVLILGVALAVAAVPEGLPAVVTAVLAIGVQRMARRNAIVRRLAAVETLGSATVIASDKTGTLTKNEMTARVIVTARGRVALDSRLDEDEAREIEPVLVAADRASNARVDKRDGRWHVEGDPTEAAAMIAARELGLPAERLDARFERIGEVPFSSERKRMSTVHRDASRGGELMVFTKGAPDVVLERCAREWAGGEARPLTSERRQEVLKTNDTLAAEALRTLAVARRTLPPGAFDPEAADDRVERDLDFLGLIGMIDPPRPEARAAVADARTAGIRSIMITGDHKTTASVIARELGILGSGRAITGAELERLDDEALERGVDDIAVYARVNPSHKMRIVSALKRRGAVVAMTGDGVNDAPALKAADIGIAMGITGTDVSKEAADMVLADDNFASIVAAVEEGRTIFANIRKFLRYLVSSNVGEVLTMFGGAVLADLIAPRAGAETVALPLLATQILWINLVTDGAPALALGIDPPDHAVMERPPRRRDEPIITGPMWRGIAVVGLVMAAGTLWVFDASLPGGFVEGHGGLRHAQTMAFTTLTLFQMFNVLNARSDTASAFRHLFANGWLWGALALSLVLQIAVIYVPFLQQAFGTVPLTAGDLVRCAIPASFVLWIREMSKFVIRRAAR